jgi:hypothetical protein
MCCDGWNYDNSVKAEDKGECPDCDEPCEVTKNNDGTVEYQALTGCHYSPWTCKTCDARPCDGSC